MGLANLAGEGFVTTKLQDMISWCRKNSLWPMPMGISCCAIELMSAGDPRHDIARFGSEVMRFSPRQSDVMIVAGTTTYKMSTVVRKIYDQMPDPKWVLSMGSCANAGGPFFNTYAAVPGVNMIVPVDVYVAGCPPRPDSLLNGLIQLQEKIKKETFRRPRRQV